MATKGAKISKKKNPSPKKRVKKVTKDQSFESKLEKSNQLYEQEKEKFLRLFAAYSTK